MENLSPSLEDYLEAVWVIGLRKKVTRVKDIVQRLGVKSASVIGALKVLVQKGLVVHERYGYVELTEKGAAAAERIYDKHKALARFFQEVLGIDSDTAFKDACQIEHYVDRKTMDRIAKFTKFIETCPEGEPLCLSGFRYFVEHGVRQRRCTKGEA